MTISNIYNQPGSSSEYFTLANNTAAVLAANLGKCKLGVETDTNNLGYTDVNGAYHSLNLTAVRSISTNQTALASDNTIECTATLTLSLYQASGSGRELTIKNFASTQNTPCVITLTPYGSDKIDGNTTFVLDNIYDWVKIKDIGIGNWTITGWNASQHTHQIYFLGDSLISGGQAAASLQASLGNAWSYQDAGVGASFTADCLTRITAITGPGDAEYAIVNPGVNDALGLIAYATIESNLQSIYTALHNASIKVIACTISPCSNCSSWTSSTQTIITTVNSWIKSGATNVDFAIDEYAVLGGGNTYLLPQYDSGDGLHPNNAGDIAYANAIYSGVTWAFQKLSLYQIGLTTTINLNQNLRTLDDVKHKSLSGSAGALWIEPYDTYPIFIGNAGNPSIEPVWKTALFAANPQACLVSLYPTSGQYALYATSLGGTYTAILQTDTGTALMCYASANGAALQTYGSVLMEEPVTQLNRIATSFYIPSTGVSVMYRIATLLAGTTITIYAGGILALLNSF